MEGQGSSSGEAKAVAAVVEPETPKDDSNSEELEHPPEIQHPPHIQQASEPESEEPKTWENLHIPANFVTKCQVELGLTKPTPVQSACIPPIFQGLNCLASSPTGTGKTLAFAIPMMSKLFRDPYGVYGLVLTPTRELALQIKEQFQLLGGPQLRVTVIVGGQDMQVQAQELGRRPHFVIGTPGRLADHMQTNNEMCKDILRYMQFLVIDEADRVLDGQFDEQLAAMRNLLPLHIQILLFSATVTEKLREITSVLMGEKRPFVYNHSVKEPERTLNEKYILCPADFKDGYLIKLLTLIRDREYEDTIRSIMIFAPTNRECEILKTLLTGMGFSCAVLHSMMPQKDRIRALVSFRSCFVQTLICTDIASRGLDILAVDLVINYSIPMPVDYVHRVGRAGRGCVKGTAISLVTPRDVKFLKNVENLTTRLMTEYKIEEREVLAILKEVSAARKTAAVGYEGNNEFEERNRVNKRKARILNGQNPSSSSSSEADSSDDELVKATVVAALKRQKLSNQ